MNKSSFFIVGQHAVIEALRNSKRRVLRVFLTEESKKNIHRKNPNKNISKMIIFVIFRIACETTILFYLVSNHFFI